MRCPTCGAEAADGLKFCETCGTRLQAQEEPTQRVDAQPAPQPYQPYQPQQTQQMPAQAQTYQQQYAAGSPVPGASPAPFPQGSYGQQKQASNAPFVLSIIALVTAVLALFPVSLVLAIIALVMNQGQKKRGEQSTKQTPTFVMALISLILSVLIALATVALGGMVWLAIMEDEVDLDHVTESTAPTQAAPAESPAGVWEVVSLTDGGETYDEEYLKLMEDMGITFQLVLAKDGTAALEFFDEQETGTWEDRGSGEVAITFDGDTLMGTISGDELTFSIDGDEMVMRRSSAEAPATVSASSNSGEATSASSAAASGSASSSAAAADTPSTTSQAAGSHDASGEPTLGDFSWYAGAGGIPAGADILTSIYDVEGTWKAYLFGNGMDRLCTLRIAAGQPEATATIDWLYVHDTSTDAGSQDSTPDSVFTGEWDGSLGLEALGPGRLALTDFWQQGDRQYGMGSFMWPSGEVDIILLVRP